MFVYIEGRVERIDANTCIFHPANDFQRGKAEIASKIGFELYTKDGAFTLEFSETPRSEEARQTLRASPSPAWLHSIMHG
jgi:hypothetical protein